MAAGSNITIMRIKEFLGLNENQDGDTKIRVGEMSEMRNFSITKDSHLQIRPGTHTLLHLRTAWEAWAAEHPEVLEEPDTDEEAPSGGVADEAAEPATEKTREELLAEDVIAKSYENTAVPPTDSEALPRPQREEEEEEEDPFDFPVDYTLWAVIGADGATRTYDSVAAAFVG